MTPTQPARHADIERTSAACDPPANLDTRIDVERARLRPHVEAHPLLHYRGLAAPPPSLDTLALDPEHQRLRACLLAERAVVEFIVCRVFLANMQPRAGLHREATSSALVERVASWLRDSGLPFGPVGEGPFITAALASRFHIQRASRVSTSVFINASARSLRVASERPVPVELRGLVLEAMRREVRT
ncbi:MAG: hypothetical protein Q8P41_00275 [Pseudomonadota bacterium]|nr:hypothetical protein [Pseudomonadota bacterium]